MFIDYQKAYVKVNRQKLIDYLYSMGCGTSDSLTELFNNKEGNLLAISKYCKDILLLYKP